MVPFAIILNSVWLINVYIIDVHHLLLKHKRAFTIHWETLYITCVAIINTLTTTSIYISEQPWGTTTPCGSHTCHTDCNCVTMWRAFHSIYLVHHSVALDYNQSACNRRQTTVHKSRYLRDYCCHLSDNMLVDLHSRVCASTLLIKRPIPRPERRSSAITARSTCHLNFMSQFRCLAHRPRFE